LPEKNFWELGSVVLRVHENPYQSLLCDVIDLLNEYSALYEQKMLFTNSLPACHVIKITDDITPFVKSVGITNDGGSEIGSVWTEV